MMMVMMMRLKDQCIITAFRHLTQTYQLGKKCRSDYHRLSIFSHTSQILLYCMQEPNARFTYCQQYHFRTVTPISVEEIAKQYDQFVYYSHNTALEDNQHPKDPDAHRKVDLKQVRNF